jgi:hypothetical protein
MPYFLTAPENSVLGDHQYQNAQGHTECVEFVRQTTGAPNTSLWQKGDKVMDAEIGAIRRGTAIATFVENGRYPTDGHGRHAAIYLSHSAVGIQVLDQWNAQGRVLPRTIYLNKPAYPRSNCAKHFYIIE